MPPRLLLCVRCALLHPAAPMCPLHPDEPLLDPADERVVLGGVISIKRFEPRFARWTKDPGAEPGGY